MEKLTVTDEILRLNPTLVGVVEPGEEIFLPPATDCEDEPDALDDQANSEGPGPRPKDRGGNAE